VCDAIFEKINDFRQMAIGIPGIHDYRPKLANSRIYTIVKFCGSINISECEM